MASHDAVENSGSSSAPPSLIEPYRPTASQATRIRKPVTDPMKNQSSVTKNVLVNSETVLEKDFGQRIPATAMAMQHGRAI